MNPSQLLEAVADCLCETIRLSTSVPDVCFCGVVPGEGIVADFSGGCTDGRQGMAWVRLTTMYPASGVDVVNDNVNNCASGLGIDFEIGILRPIVTVDARGNPPTAEQYRDAGRLMNDDALVMYRAIACCGRLGDFDYILGTFAPAGPAGGVMGGTWPVAVLLD